MQIDEFRLWLESSTEFTKKTKSNILSRLKRANKILPVETEPVYLFNLSQMDEFNSLSVNVKSQLRRAVKIYVAFIGSKEK